MSDRKNLNPPPMVNLSPPGVYLYEETEVARSIVAAGTSVVGFVGAAPLPSALLNEPKPVSSWAEFQAAFMVASDGTNSDSWTFLAHAVYGFFQNGGRRCWVVNVGGTDSVRAPLTDDAGATGLDQLAKIAEIAIVAAPGFTAEAEQNLVLAHCEQAGDRIGILDIVREPAAGMYWSPEELAKIPSSYLKVRRPETGVVTAYFPWLQISDPVDGTKRISVPPSGHVAGVWARTDEMRGVAKAPANEEIRGVIGLDVLLSNQQQGPLNEAGVNVIRYFSREGYKIWGARTLATLPEWRYVNVRRLVTNIEESLAIGTRWVVFEAKDEALWAQIRHEVSDFLTQFWRAGAIVGNSPPEAFFVKCDAENNPPESVRENRVILDIGIAPVRPAEFVIIRIVQMVHTNE